MPTLLFRSMQVDSTIAMTENAEKLAEIVAEGTAGAENQEEAKPAKLSNDPACSHL
jgi:predicted FMN-binding regulatory protein PaiB